MSKSDEQEISEDASQGEHQTGNAKIHDACHEDREDGKTIRELPETVQVSDTHKSPPPRK